MTQSVADVDGFINLLRAACDDPTMHQTLMHLLSQPDDRRRVIVQRLLDDLIAQQAPEELAQAIACLVDDAVAEKAYDVIFQCRRP